MKYIPTIGLEIHAELKTKTKMFCASKNDPTEERPNVNVCPVCMGHPGTLPVINKEAVRQVLRMGVALKGKLADYTEFDRKNYFYPDIPKGYQISQYKFPLVEGGELAGVKLTRVHLEEDTAKSTHDRGEDSLVDFNRAGVPLMELVTEPVISSAEEAVAFAKELQLLLIYLGASDANMEKGQMRVEANISISSESGRFGTKVEVKNLNSFRAVEKAINYELERQSELLDRGEVVTQETRGWDENKEETFSQRKKEESHDYRYFPEPDLPKLVIGNVPEFGKKILSDSLPELPWTKRERLVAQYGVKNESVEVFVRDTEFADYFEAVVNDLTGANEYRLAENYITSDIASMGGRPEPEEVVTIIKMLSANEISSRGAKEILKYIDNGEKDARAIAEKYNLIQKSDKASLQKIVEKIIEGNEKAVSEYRLGKNNSLEFLVGQVMKESKGSANPQIVRELLVELLK